VGRIVCNDQWLTKEKLFGLKLGYLMSIDAFALVPLIPLEACDQSKINQLPCILRQYTSRVK
jgi:hypothetical protein